MAAANKNSNLIMASVVTTLVFIALMTDFANASSLRAWNGPGCTNTWQQYGSCGRCININHFGGYQFNYNGQPARIYNQGGCRGGFTWLRRSARSCNPFGWRSIHIVC
ncbi:Antimicrobial protein MiAMP1 [Macleaya cordata]|uniref:Antimicrobial protein MiAMP1 n=1 Tax=Macleaya cordata TaxID=56857 RepID=A0A200Q2J3_MACCD|nr:Antimicrobial protein MiAMP1 [Macleaya cordata]